jgi:hypothetical protein
MGLLLIIIMGYIILNYGIIIYYNPKNLGFQDFGTLGLKYWGFNWRFATSTFAAAFHTHSDVNRSFSAVAQPISWARHDHYRNHVSFQSQTSAPLNQHPWPNCQLCYLPIWKSAF